jgi:hypothetical protein
MVSVGVVAGAAAGAVGGFMGKTLLGGFVGALGGGALGYLGWRSISRPEPGPEAPQATEGGLSGVMAVL